MGTTLSGQWTDQDTPWLDISSKSLYYDESLTNHMHDQRRFAVSKIPAALCAISIWSPRKQTVGRSGNWTVLAFLMKSLAIRIIQNSHKREILKQSLKILFVPSPMYRSGFSGVLFILYFIWVFCLTSGFTVSIFEDPKIKISCDDLTS